MGDRFYEQQKGTPKPKKPTKEQMAKDLAEKLGIKNTNRFVTEIGRTTVWVIEELLKNVSV